MSNSIKNQDKYVTEMRKSMLDKVFFFDKIFEPIENIVDFGCADGSLIEFCKGLFPDYNYIGYDINEDMIKRAKKHVYPWTSNHGIVNFTSDWDSIDVDKSKSLLNLSSVIHEVYTYQDEAGIEEFWNRVLNSGFKYISIRDMALWDCFDSGEPYITNLLNNYKGKDVKYLEKLDEFKELWGVDGNLSDYEAIHFLLKAQYSFYDNWDREIKENYLPITVLGIYSRVLENYEICYSDHYVFPYLKWWLKKNLDIDLNVPTHLKLVLKRKEDCQEDNNG